MGLKRFAANTESQKWSSHFSIVEINDYVILISTESVHLFILVTIEYKQNMTINVFFITFTLTHTHTHTHKTNARVHTHTHTHTQKYVYTYMYMHTRICTHTDIYIYIYYISNIQPASEDSGCGLFAYRLYEEFHVNLWECSIYANCYIFFLPKFI